jgi:hypothetical protein
MHPLIRVLTIAAALALGACASTPGDSPQSSASPAENGAEPTDAQLLEGLSERERQLCVFDSATPPDQRYQVIRKFTLTRSWYGGGKNFIPYVAQQAVKQDADALLEPNGYNLRNVVGMSKAFFTARAVKWVQPPGKTCAEMGGLPLETMVLTNKTSAGQPLFPFRNVFELDIKNLVRAPLEDSGVITLPPVKNGSSSSTDKTRAAILTVAQAADWNVEQDAPGQLRLKKPKKLENARSTVEVTVTYDATTYEVKYVSSTGFDFDEKSRFIDNKGNTHIRDLIERINKAYTR